MKDKELTLTDKKIVEVKKQIGQILNKDTSTTEKVEELWDFFYEKNKVIGVLVEVQKALNRMGLNEPKTEKQIS